jgi:hypothetical protein
MGFSETNINEIIEFGKKAVMELKNNKRLPQNSVSFGKSS